MNIENILKVADAIEQHSVPGMAFHMNYTHQKTSEIYEGNGKSPDQIAMGPSCGSVACIIGWTNTTISPRDPRNFASEIRAADHLGLDYYVAHSLFYPKDRDGVGCDYDSITPEQGVRVLRNLAETGKVDWSV